AKVFEIERQRDFDLKVGTRTEIDNAYKARCKEVEEFTSGRLMAKELKEVQDWKEKQLNIVQVKQGKVTINGKELSGHPADKAIRDEAARREQEINNRVSKEERERIAQERVTALEEAKKEHARQLEELQKKIGRSEKEIKEGAEKAIKAVNEEAEEAIKAVNE